MNIEEMLKKLEENQSKSEMLADEAHILEVKLEELEEKRELLDDEYDDLVDEIEMYFDNHPEEREKYDWE